jgi:hypothetical protein
MGGVFMKTLVVKFSDGATTQYDVYSLAMSFIAGFYFVTESDDHNNYFEFEVDIGNGVYFDYNSVCSQLEEYSQFAKDLGLTFEWAFHTIDLAKFNGLAHTV